MWVCCAYCNQVWVLGAGTTSASGKEQRFFSNSSESMHAGALTVREEHFHRCVGLRTNRTLFVKRDIPREI